MLIYIYIYCIQPLISVASLVQNTMKKSLFMGALEVVGMCAEERVKDTDRWLWSLYNNKTKRFSAAWYYHSAILNWQWCQAMD